MTKIFSKALQKTTSIERIIGYVKGVKSGPTIIFTAGIHGNEPSGIFALQRVIRTIEKDKISINGSMYAIAGNLNALEKGVRYSKQDLNRLWTSQRMEKINNKTIEFNNADEKQQLEINTLIESILQKEKGPFYFIDLHTTSSNTIPFLTVNDSLLNRKYTHQFPVPIILGIEEYLEGPLLSYINELGYVAFGFEGGQHDSIEAIENHIAFIYLSLIFSNLLDAEAINFKKYYDILNIATEGLKDIYEIFYHYKIKENERFLMKPGFVNFQKITKKQSLAKSNNNSVYAHKDCRILMPQYQSQGEDGFFTIRRIPKFYLKLSSFLRRINFHRILPLLPGVKWQSNKYKTLVVNRKIAWLFAKQFFHLLGYRNKKIDKTHLIIKSRESASRYKEYPMASWK